MIRRCVALSGSQIGLEGFGVMLPSHAISHSNLLGGRRVVPIESKLYQLLLGAFAKAKEGENRICPISRHCLWRNFQNIRKRAGLARWKDAFKVMRRNCETDWAQVYPQYAVSAWIGHGIEVSARHYLQVPEELYDKIAALNKAQTATKTATKPQAEPAVARRKF